MANRRPRATAASPVSVSPFVLRTSLFRPYLFLAPFLLPFGAFFLYPLCRSLALSFCATSAGGRPRFVGLANYAYLLGDWTFWLALLNTAIYTALFLAVQVPLSLGLAVLLNSPRVGGRGPLRFAFFATGLVGSVFVAVVFGQLLNPRHDPVAAVAGFVLGRPVAVPWLTTLVGAHLAVIVAWLWVSVGFAIVYLLAALQAIDAHLYEAAAVDGAGPWERFRHVTLPGVRPVLTFLVGVGLVGGLQLFELPYVLLGGPGPQFAGFTVVMYLYQVGFQQGNLGYASAIGWALVLIVMVAAIPELRRRRTPA